MNIKKISSILFLYTFSFIQCMEITPSQNHDQITDIGLQKLIEETNKSSLCIANIIKKQAAHNNIQLIPKNIGSLLQLTQKEIDDLFLKNVSDDTLRPLLLSMGADIKAKWDDGQNCLWHIKKPELLTELINNGAEVDVRSTGGENALMNILLFETNDESIASAEILLKHGSDVNIIVNVWGSLLERILSHKKTVNRLKAATLLCKYNINVNAKTRFNCSPLITAIKEGEIELVELFLQYGANKEINTVDTYDECPLHAAMQKEEHYYYNHTRPIVPKIVLLLLHYGANPNIAYHDGLTMPLHVAADRSQPTIIKELINKKADIYRTDKSGFTAYDIAKQRGYTQDILNVLYVNPQPKKEMLFNQNTGTLTPINPEESNNNKIIQENPSPGLSGSCSIQ